jgi:hypothetical protein
MTRSARACVRVRAQGLHDELYSFNLSTMTWTLLATSVVPDGTIIRPSARSGHGFESDGGKLYVHGGVNNNGGKCLCVCVCGSRG